MTRSQRPHSARRRIVTGAALACAFALALVGGVTFTTQAVALWRDGAPLDGLVLPMIVFGVASLVAVALVVLVGWFVTGAALRSIAQVRAAADSMTLADLSRRLPGDGGEGIADLSQSVNSMLDRLEGSVDSQRQLLDDVRHELKTPITIVRGHLEIMDASDRAEVDATRAIGIAELDRLGWSKTSICWPRRKPTPTSAMRSSSLRSRRGWQTWWPSSRDTAGASPSGRRDG